MTTYRPGEPVTIEARAEAPLILHYRHVNQSEPWEAIELKGQATIPAEYTKSEYPLQYYFESDGALHPGLAKDFTRAPYYVIRQTT